MPQSKSYIATQTEASALHAGTQTALISKVKPQPTDCSRIHQKAEEICTWRNEPMMLIKDIQTGRFYCKYCGNGCDYSNNFEGIQPPYPIGSEVYVREAITHSGNGQAIYRADAQPVRCHADPELIEHIDNFKEGRKRGYISPATMPREAARTWLVAVESVAVRVQFVTEQQAMLFGLKPMKEDHIGWHSHRRAFEWLAINKFGQQAWDDNIFIFITRVNKKA